MSRIRIKQFPDEWLPICSAPHDGATVDIWCSFIDNKGNIEFNKVDGRFPDSAFFDGKWCTMGDVALHESVDYTKIKKDQRMMVVTHWRKRPAAPTKLK